MFIISTKECIKGLVFVFAICTDGELDYEEMTKWQQKKKKQMKKKKTGADKDICKEEEFDAVERVNVCVCGGGAMLR